MSIEAIFEYSTGYDFAMYLADIKTRQAIERNFEIIGEASSRITAIVKQENPQIDWRVIKDFRNFMIHEYFGINHRIVWQTIQLRLAPLLEEIRKLR